MKIGGPWGYVMVAAPVKVFIAASQWSDLKLAVMQSHHRLDRLMCNFWLRCLQSAFEACTVGANIKFP